MGRKKKHVYVRKMRGDNTRFVLNEKAVIYYRTHPLQAAKDLLGVELAWYQKITLINMWYKSRVRLIFGRASGKTWGIATFAVLWAMLFPHTKIGVLGPSGRQGGFIFNEIQTLYDKSPFFRGAARKGVSRNPQGANVRFINGSFIESTPIGDGSKVRGARYHVLCLDEVAQFNPSIIDLVIMPFMGVQLKHRRNKLIMSSSAFFKHNHLWDRYKFWRKKIEIEKNENYWLGEFNYEDVNLDPDGPFHMDMETVEHEKEIMTNAEFQMEWLGRFPDESDSYFTSKLIEECTPKEGHLTDSDMTVPVELSCWTEKGAERVNNGHNYVLGVDIGKAPGAANFSIAVGKLSGKELQLVNMITLNGASTPDMVKSIRYCTINYNVVRIQMDKGGGGEFLKDELAKPWYDPVEEKMHLPILDMDDPDTKNAAGLRYLRLVAFQGAKHSNLFTNLKAEMEHGRVKFPINQYKDIEGDKERERALEEIRLTKTELMVIQKTPRGANLHFDVPSNYRMDRAVGLCLAVDAVIDEREPIWAKKEPAVLPVGGWI